MAHGQTLGGKCFGTEKGPKAVSQFQNVDHKLNVKLP